MARAAATPPTDATAAEPPPCRRTLALRGLDAAIAFGLLSTITLAQVSHLQPLARSRWPAALFCCWACVLTSEARADCSSRGAEVAIPGSYQRVAPKNTRVFVTSTSSKLQGAELRRKDDGARVPTRATSRVDAENGSRSIELIPEALLEPGKAYEVHRVLDSGSTKLATFRVVDVIDQTPPRMGEAELTLSSRGSLALDALVDDTTSDDNLRLLLWQGQQDPDKPGTPPPLAELLPDRFSAGQARYFLEGRDDECNSRWHSYPETKPGTVFTLALVDQAGNVSAPRLVTLTEEPPRLRDDEAKASLYYVPGAKLLVQARTLVFGAAAALLALLALAFAWRSRRRRAA